MVIIPKSKMLKLTDHTGKITVSRGVTDLGAHQVTVHVVCEDVYGVSTVLCLAKLSTDEAHKLASALTTAAA
jgi:hypothetical protein